MTRNYLGAALRNFRNYKAYSLINIIGLAVGITCCIAILLYVRNDGILFDTRLLLLTSSTVS
jgi:putative ABC transport system permease protein